MDKRQILVKEYELTKQSYNNVIKDYRQQTNILSTYITVFLGLAAFVFKQSGSESTEALISISSDIYPLIISLSGIIYVYFYAQVIDVVYHLYLVEAYLSSLEERINELVEKDLLNYDNKTISFFNETLIAKGEWVNPSILSGSISLFILLAFCTFHLYLGYYFIDNKNYLLFFIVGLSFLTTYLVFQFLLLQGNGREFIKRKTYEINGISLSGNHQRSYATTNNYTVPLLTFFFGFFTFLTDSILHDSLWANSKVDIPLIYQYTIMIGDALLLPIINFMLYKLMFNKIGTEKLFAHRKNLTISLIIVLVFSVVGSSYTHWAWTIDPYSDFIAYTPGIITTGGVWHLVFSIIQTTLLLFFPVLWYISIKEKQIVAVKYARKIWVFVLLFSSLMILNFLHQKQMIYGDLTMLKALYEAKFTFVNVFVSLIILLVMELLWSRRKPL